MIQLGPPYDFFFFFATFVVALVSGLVPLVNIEVVLVGLATLTGAAPVPVVLLVTLGQMLAKVVLYYTGRGALRLPVGRARHKVDRAAEALRRHAGRAQGMVLFSALTGIPPFYGTSIAAGVLRIPIGQFLVPATFGRLVRFSLVFALPWLLVK